MKALQYFTKATSAVWHGGAGISVRHDAVAPAAAAKRGRVAGRTGMCLMGRFLSSKASAISIISFMDTISVLPRFSGCGSVTNS